MQQKTLTGLSRRRIQFKPGIAAWLLDHPIRPRQHIRRNRQADLFGRFEIDDELELFRLLRLGNHTAWEQHHRNHN